jgi:hypothetical protein
MASIPNTINLSSDSSDSADSSDSPFILPTLLRGLTKEQARKKKHDVPAPKSTSSEEEDDERDTLYSPTTHEKPQSSRLKHPTRGRKEIPHYQKQER